MTDWTGLHPFHPVQPCMASSSHGVLYREERPSPCLAGVVECFWELRAAGDAAAFTCLGMPDGCVDWVFGSNDFRATSVMALLSSAVRIAIAPHRSSFGVRFLPAAVNLVSGEPLGDIYDRRLAVQDMIKPGIAALQERVFESADFHTKKTLVEEWLGARLARSRYEPPPSLLACLDRIYQAHGNLGIAELARLEGTSERQVRRLFHTELGLAPKAFTRVVRFQRVLRGLAKCDGAALALALDAGYYDQPHFIHEFRALCGATPMALARDYPMRSSVRNSAGMSDSYNTARTTMGRFPSKEGTWLASKRYRSQPMACCSKR